jgi:hypothetical protein
MMRQQAMRNSRRMVKSLKDENNGRSAAKL